MSSNVTQTTGPLSAGDSVRGRCGGTGARWRLVAVVVATVATALVAVVAGPGTANAAEGSWAATGALATPRSDQSATLLTSGKVLVAGGRTASAALTSAERYDPVTGLFTSTGAMSTSRWAHTATRLSDGKVLVGGGFTGLNVNPMTGTSTNAQSVTDTAEIYDPATGTWTPTGSMVTRRAIHSAALLDDGRVLVAGGRSCGGPPPAICDFMVRTVTAEIYDPATGTWTATGPMKKPRHTTTAVKLPDGRVLVPAGFSDTNPIDSDGTADLYDPAGGTWSLTANLNFDRARQGGMLLPDGTALVTGFREFNIGPPVFSRINDTSEIYNPITNTWTVSAGRIILPARFNFQQAVMPNGKALVAGGASATSVLQRSAEVYDPVAQIWTSAGLMTRTHGSSSGLSNSHDAIVLSIGPCGANCGKVLVVGDNLTDGTADLYTPGPAGTPVRATETKVACAQAAVGPDTLTCAAMTGENEPSGNSQTGTVGFFLDAINSPGFIGQCTLGPLAPGLSRCTTTTSAISAGPHTVWALYFGDSLYSASVGSDDVGNPSSGPPEPSDTKVLCAPMFGAPTNVPFRCASLVADDDADVTTPAPTAQVGFFRDAINSPSFVGQCTLAPLAGAISACDTTTAATTPPGPHTMWGLYFGDGAYSASVDSDAVTA